MCAKLENNGKIIIPGVKTDVHTRYGIKPLTWGINLGHGWMVNARIESVMKNIWVKHSLIDHGYIEATSFFEKNNRFYFKKTTPIAIIHNNTNFLVVTEPANKSVKPYHHRQPCWESIKMFLQKAA